MNSNEIKSLLEKYYDGNTTLREEHLLRELFQRSDLPDHLKREKALFDFFALESKQELTATFQEEPWAPPTEGRKVSMITHSKRWMVPLSLAASILLLLAVTILFRMGIFSPPQPFGSVSDPELAYTETCKALEMVSNRFNTGLGKAKDLDAFTKGMNKAEKLKQFNQYQPISIHQDEQ